MLFSLREKQLVFAENVEKLLEIVASFGSFATLKNALTTKIFVEDLVPKLPTLTF